MAAIFTSVAGDQIPFTSIKTQLRLPHEWEVLGPFPTGTREQGFGADILEAFGGFKNILYSKTDLYPSDLADNGTVRWSRIKTAPDGKTIGPLEFTQVRWNDNGHFYGWASSQYIVYLRGDFKLDKDTSILVQCRNTGYFSIDDVEYSGDWYASDSNEYGVSRHLVHLSKGWHQMSLKIINEVRIFGGHLPPDPISINVEMGEVMPSDFIRIVKERWMIPDLVEGFNIQPHAAVSVQNILNEDLKIVSLRVSNGVQVLEQNVDIGVKTGQHRPLPFKILDADEQQFLTITTEDRKRRRTSVSIKIPRRVRRKYGHLFQHTFIDYDGTVQYAMVLPPMEMDKRNTFGKTKVILALHGAGVEVQTSSFWTSSLNRQRKAWIVFPTGRTAWGYDWHGPSMRNAFYAVNSIRPYVGMELALTFISPNGIPDVSEFDLIYCGHSNGSQGAWYLATHFPFALGLLAVAGFSSIEDYVPYTGWMSWSHIDPVLKGLLLSSIAEYNHDLHISNVKGMKILVKSGAEDDNVPPLQSRKLNRLVQMDSGLNASKMVEVPGRSHFWDGAMRDFGAQTFLEDLQEEAQFQNTHLLDEFTLTVMNPGEHAGKGGIMVEQLQVPFRVGRIRVYREDGIIKMKTSNIKRFRIVIGRGLNPESKTEFGTDSFSPFFSSAFIHKDEHVLVDGIQVDFKGIVELKLYKPDKGNNRDKASKWIMSDDASWMERERNPSNYGAIQSIYSTTRGPLLIIVGTVCESMEELCAENRRKFMHIAETIAVDWFMYGGGDATIIKDEDVEDTRVHSGNVILVGGEGWNSMASKVIRPGFPISMSRTSIQLEGEGTVDAMYINDDYGLLALYPSQWDSLCVVISGTSVKGVERAAAVFPKRTGMPVPDWMVTTEAMAAKGLGGIAAAGYFDNFWGLSDVQSYVT